MRGTYHAATSRRHTRTKPPTVLGELTLNNPNRTEQDAREILAALGLAGLESRHPGSLSGGQKQRLSLGVALASGRRLLLYDEPTSGQDGENLLRTAQQITSANQNAVCTLMVTHDPELIFQCATHILHLKDGRPQAFFPLNRDGAERLWQIFGASEFDEFDSERSLNNMKHLSVWDQLVQLPYLNLYGKVVSSALELDLFTHLQEKKTPAELAQAMGWNEANTGYLLAALGTYGFVQKEGNGYVNSQEAQKYLVRGTPDYLGGFIHFYGQNEGMVPMDVKKLLTEGPQPIYTRMRPCFGYESTKAPASGTPRRGLLVWLWFSAPDRGGAFGGGLFPRPAGGPAPPMPCGRRWWLVPFGESCHRLHPRAA